MSTTLLRTLTRKSLMKFGIYCDSTVNEMLIFKKYNYLRWVYFNCDMVSFTDDILDEISITEEYRIKKPGKCPGKDQEIINMKKAKMTPLERHILNCKQKRDDKIKASKRIQNGNWHFKKDSLRSKNQGRNKFI